MRSGLVEPDSIDPRNMVRGVHVVDRITTNTICLGRPTGTVAPRHRILQLPPDVCTSASAGATLLGPTCRSGYVCRKCACNALNALVRRHGVEPPAPTSLWLHAEEYVSSLISARPWLVGPVDPTDWRGWLSRWPLAKVRTILTSVARDPIRPWLLQAMIKRESGHAMPKKARLIQYYPNQHTQAVYGPMFVALQKAIFAWVPTFVYRGVRITYASGLNSKGIADWMSGVYNRFHSVRFYERDGTNWDSTMQRFHHDLKMRIYRAYDAGFAEFVELGFRATAHASFPNGTLSYILDGTVKSGHNDTTLGNSIINSMIALEAVVQSGHSAEIIVVGDDLIVATDGDPSGYAAIEASYGIRPEARCFDDYIDISFISGCWLRASDGFVFVPRLGRLLARLWWSVNPPSARQYQNYRYSVVHGLRASCGSVPLYSEFLQADDGLVIPEKDRDMWLANFGGAVADATTERDICRKYWLLPSELAELRNYFRSLPRGPCLMSHPLVERVCDVDLADLLERPLACC